MKQGVSPAVAVIIIVIVVAVVALVGWKYMSRGGGPGSGEMPQGPEAVKAAMKKGGMMEPQQPPGAKAAPGKAGPAVPGSQMPQPPEEQPVEPE